ncbi:MAG TPA: hypothetical protein VKG25_15310 [Bryobacteraceae bacterium]|nr:hypothetical protein [Bryobacteraceae bacterium]
MYEEERSPRRFDDLVRDPAGPNIGERRRTTELELQASGEETSYPRHPGIAGLIGGHNPAEAFGPAAQLIQMLQLFTIFPAIGCIGRGVAHPQGRVLITNDGISLDDALNFIRVGIDVPRRDVLNGALKYSAADRFLDEFREVAFFCALGTPERCVVSDRCPSRP